MRFGPGFLLVLAACTTTPKPSAAPPPLAKAEPAPVKRTPPTLRLPEGVRPLSAELDLRVVPGEETLSGEAKFELELSRPVEVIWLNASGLTPRSAELETFGRVLPATLDSSSDKFLGVVPPAALGPGKASLRIRYTAPLLRKDTAGFFQLREGGEDYAYTDFEPIDARRAFPCFDDPQFKMPWKVTLHVKRVHVAVSNTPALTEHDEPQGMKAVSFAPTRPLPSYLVAMAVGPFSIGEAGRFGQNKVPVRVIGPRGREGDMAWALQSTGPILEQLEGYFGSAYPWDKLDLIAVPIRMGAMENPGLITFGHQLLLAHGGEAGPEAQRRFAEVCAHELAHMWFGDLVTMAWWDDLWLNEAFATWMEPKIIGAWKPGWDADIRRVQSRSFALGADSLTTARRIRQPIATEDDILNAFDGITYSKGASVIGMFEAWAGPQAFQQGVRSYLSEHAFKNATATDFLGAISKAADKDVTGPFGTFLDQPGAPQLTFELQCAKGGTPKLLVTQRRSLPVGSRGEARQAWQVPVCARWSSSGKEGRACTLLTGETGELTLEGTKSCPEWVLPNDRMEGYYRANLATPGGLQKLLERAGKKLSIAERVGVLGDLRSLVASGAVDVSEALAALPLALKEDNRHLTHGGLAISELLDEHLVPESLRPRLEDFIRQTFGARARKLGLTVGAKDSEDVRLARPELVGYVAIEGKDPELRAKAVALANAWLTDRKAVHPDLVETVLAIAADTDDAGLHEKLLTAAKTEGDRVDRMRMLVALGQFRAQELVKAHLPLVLTDTFDAREAMRLVWGAAEDRRTRDLALEFVEKNWEPLVARLPKNGGAVLVWLAGGVCEPKKRDEVRAFFENRSTKYLGGPREFAQTMEEIDLCIAYQARQQPSAVAFLEKWKVAPALKR